MQNFERNRRIRELRGLMSAAAIAKQLGVSRNTVIGVWYRSGLCDRKPDSKRKSVGRQGVRGEQHPKSKLTADQVLSIRRDYQYRVRSNCCAALASRYGVSVGTIYDIVAGRSWRAA